MSTIHLTHNQPLPTIRLYPQSAFTDNLPLPTICLYPQSGYNHFSCFRWKFGSRTVASSGGSSTWSRSSTAFTPSRTRTSPIQELSLISWPKYIGPAVQRSLIYFVRGSITLWLTSCWPPLLLFSQQQILKMCQSRPLFVYFRPFLIKISIIQIEKSLDGVLGIQTSAVGW